MAKLEDKFFNRVIEGELEVGSEDKIAPEAVASAIAGGNVDNAKPIYYHPIVITNNSNIAISLTIVNNSSTPLTTIADILAEARSWGVPVARINVSGSFIYNTELCVAHVIDVASNYATMFGFSITNAMREVQIEDFTGLLIFDAVNKIN